MRLLTVLSLLIGLSEQASAQGVGGSVRIDVDADSVYVVYDVGRLQAVKVASGEVFELPYGSHSVVIASAFAPDVSLQVDVPWDGVAEYTVDLVPAPTRAQYVRTSSYPRFHWDANLLVLTDPDTRIFVAGENGTGWVLFGEGQGRFDIPSGTHAIKLDNPRAGQKVMTTEVSESRITLVEHYLKPEKSTVRLGLLVPGLSQYFKNERVKAAVIGGGFVIGTGLALRSEIGYRLEAAEYEQSRLAYERAKSEPTVVEMWQRMESDYRDAKQWADLRRAGLAIAGGLLLYNIIDGLRSPRAGYRDQTSDPDHLIAPFFSTNSAGVRLSIRF